MNGKLWNTGSAGPEVLVWLAIGLIMKGGCKDYIGGGYIAIRIF